MPPKCPPYCAGPQVSTAPPCCTWEKEEQSFEYPPTRGNPYQEPETWFDVI